MPARGVSRIAVQSRFVRDARPNRLLQFCRSEHGITIQGEKIKKRFLISLEIRALCATGLRCQETATIKLDETLNLSSSVKGNFDHFAIDLSGSRLFATPEEYKAVLVFDVKTGKLIHEIEGIEKPHAVLYREDLNRLYITDGEAGDVKIFDGASYKLLSTVILSEVTDSIRVDLLTKRLYVDNGGGDVYQTFSMLSIVDATAVTKVARIKIIENTL